MLTTPKKDGETEEGQPTMLLTKSDFKVARTCGTKLYYRKLGYPTTSDDDPYLEFLADGGYMIEAIAKLLFPEGREIVADSVRRPSLRQDRLFARKM